MGALRSALEELASQPDVELSNDQLNEDIVELIHHRQQTDALLARKVGSFTVRGGHIQREQPSAVSYLKSAGRVSTGTAARIVAQANASESAPQSFAAWTGDRISTDQAVSLFEMAGAVPSDFPDAEATLIDIVEDLPVADTRKVLAYWRQSVDGPGAVDINQQRLRRGLSLSRTIGGMHRLDGRLTPTAGSALSSALDSLMPPPAEDDSRTPRQRRHDALEDLTFDYLEHGDTPVVGGQKPNLNLLADLAALRGIAGGTHETENGDVLDVATIRRLACDSSVSRIVLGPESEPIDVGRKRRTVSAAMRRGVIARDRHCQYPGCDRGPRWCDVHHTTPWAEGGETSISESKLLCRFHHTLEHERRDRQRSI